MHEPVAVAPLPSEAEPGEGAAGSRVVGLGTVGVQGQGAGAVGVPVSPSVSMGVSWPVLSQGETLWGAGPSFPHARLLGS